MCTAYPVFFHSDLLSRFSWSAPPPVGVEALPRGHSLESESVVTDVRGGVLDLFAQRSEDEPQRPSRQLLSLPWSTDPGPGAPLVCRSFPSECRTPLDEAAQRGEFP